MRDVLESHPILEGLVDEIYAELTLEKKSDNFKKNAAEVIAKMRGDIGK